MVNARARERGRMVVALMVVLAGAAVTGATAANYPLSPAYTIQNEYLQLRVGDIFLGDEFADGTQYPGLVEQKARFMIRTTGGEPTVIGDETADLTGPQYISVGSDFAEGLSGFTMIAIGDPTQTSSGGTGGGGGTGGTGGTAGIRQTNSSNNYEFVLYGNPDDGTFTPGGGEVQSDLIETYWIPTAQNWVEITQAIHLVRDKARIEYTVTNTSSTQDAIIGIRLLVDNQRGAGDEGPIYWAQDASRVLTSTGIEQSFIEEREWPSATDPLRRWFWYLAPDSVASPEVVCGAIVESVPEPRSTSMDAQVPADRIVLGNWNRLYGTTWDITVDQGRRASDDLATVVFWGAEDPLGRVRRIPPGAKRRFVCYYGLGSATEDVSGTSAGASPRVVAATMAPFSLHLTSDQTGYDYGGDTGFLVGGYMSAGPKETREVTGNTAALTLPEGLESDEARTKPLPNLSAGETGAVLWHVRPTGEKFGEFTYTVTLTSQGGGSKSLSRSIEVPALPSMTTPELVPPNPPYEGELPGGSYRMFSVPFELTDSDARYGLRYLSAADSTQEVTPRIFTYNPNTARYDEYPTGSRARDIVAGSGYWLLLDEAVRIEVESGNATPLNSANVVAIPLLASGGGFNQVGCPYTYGVRLREVEVEFEGRALGYADAVSAGWVRGTFWFWDPEERDGRGGYGFFGAQETVLAPWMGYWCKALVDCHLLVYPPDHLGANPPLQPFEAASSSASAAKSRSGGTRDDWMLQLVASSPRVSDSANFIGVSPAASRGYDALDVDEPPVIGPYVQLAFPHPNWGRNSGLYTQDIRSAGGAEQAWDVQVRTNLAGEQVRIEWPTMARLPRELEAYLEDVQTGKRIYMRSSGGYTFTADDTGVRDLRVIVKPRGGGLAVATFDVAETIRGGGAQFVYTLSAAAQVDISVINAAGRRVANVVQGEDAVAGRNTAVWNGRSDTGALVPGGSYRVVLTARSDEGGQVSSVRSLTVE